MRSDVSMLLPLVLGPSWFCVLSSWTIAWSYMWFVLSTTTLFCTKRAWPVPNSEVLGMAAKRIVLDGRAPALDAGPTEASLHVESTSPNLAS